MNMGTTRIGTNNFGNVMFFIHLIYETKGTRQGEFVNGLRESRQDGGRCSAHEILKCRLHEFSVLNLERLIMETRLGKASVIAYNLHKPLIKQGIGF